MSEDMKLEKKTGKFMKKKSGSKQKSAGMNGRPRKKQQRERGTEKDESTSSLLRQGRRAGGKSK